MFEQGDDQDRRYDGVTLPGVEAPVGRRRRLWRGFRRLDWRLQFLPFFGVLVVAFGIVGALLPSDEGGGAGGGGAANGSGLPANDAPAADGSGRPAADAPAPGSDPGKPVTVSGEATGGRRLELTLPESIDLWERAPATATGHTGGLPGGVGGVTVAAYAAPVDDQDAECPARIPGETEGARWSVLVLANVYGEGPLRAGGNQPTPTEPGTYRVCGWVEPFTGSRTGEPSLAAEGELEIRDAELPAGFDALGGYLEGGTYAAQGEDVDGSPTGTRVEFAIEAGPNGRRDVTYLAATNLPTGQCAAGGGEPKRADVFSKVQALSSLGLLGEATMEPDLVLTGGSPGRGEYHGQIAHQPDVRSRCRGHIAFVARRLPEGQHPLRDRLDR